MGLEPIHKTQFIVNTRRILILKILCILILKIFKKKLELLYVVFRFYLIFNIIYYYYLLSSCLSCNHGLVFNKQCCLSNLGQITHDLVLSLANCTNNEFVETNTASYTATPSQLCLHSFTFTSKLVFFTTSPLQLRLHILAP